MSVVHSCLPEGWESDPFCVLSRVEDLLRYRLSRESIPYAVGSIEEVRAELRSRRGNRSHPETDAGWVDAKDKTPSRRPYTDGELQSLRIDQAPGFMAGSVTSMAVVIWTLLDMIETQKGWKLL